MAAPRAVLMAEPTVYVMVELMVARSADEKGDQKAAKMDELLVVH